MYTYYENSVYEAIRNIASHVLKLHCQDATSTPQVTSVQRTILSNL